MVRLLLNGCVVSVIDYGQFQSHNGAIAASVMSKIMQDQSLVSIPQWCDCCPPTFTILQAQNTRFNPTMVRLLLVQLLLEGERQRRFQSHNGAIAA